MSDGAHLGVSADRALETILGGAPSPAEDEGQTAEEMRGVDLADLGLSGFQWGWAVNAARRCVELPPVANPAIVNI